MTRRRLRSNLYWFTGVQALTALLFVMAVASGVTEIRYGLGILAFQLSSISISVFGFRLFRPRKPDEAATNGTRSFSPFAMAAFSILVATPTIIGVLPLFGYFDTAVELQSRIFESGILFLCVAIIYGLLMRMFLVAHRRFALKKARLRRTEIEVARNAANQAEASGEAMPSAPAPAPNLDTIGAQSRSILLVLSGIGLATGLWMIWSEILPALGVADDIVLWERSVTVDGVEVHDAVTVWNVLLFAGLFFGGIIAARNIQGILEIALFQRFSVEPGTRYAVVAIAAYLLIGIGVIAGFSQLGLDWSKLQWIVAALGVGLGFGLQEIVANFVSGIIILFERPVRVGDTVTIGTLSGTVSNIKIRATTITDFDNREVLLPNKSIITENVTNWTLNDSVTRLVLSVGVAYGSDIDAVRKILSDVLSAHPDVLKTPPPTVFFMAHGDSSLNFELRLFVEAPAKRLPVTHDVNAAVNAELNRHGIEIPFPQRDVYIRKAKTQ